MNVLGKIFVIANLIFSVVTMALIIMVYATRTNWHARYLEMENQAKLAQGNMNAYADLISKTKAEEKKKQDELSSNLAKATAALQEQITTNAVDKSELAKQKVATEKTIQENKGLVEVNVRLQQESDLKGKQLAASNARIVDLEKEKGAFRNRAVEAEIASDRQREINERLLEDNERLTKDVQKLKAANVVGAPHAGAPGTAAVNPPLEDLEGVVEDVKSGYLTISLGSNHGLQRNHTMEVFRLGTDPKYLGTLRITDVRADKAVGLLTKRLAPVQIGDRVASRIPGG